MHSAHPEEVGFSSARLRRITSTVHAAIDRGEVAGAVALVARHGQVVHHEASGLLDVAAGTPMRPDTIFRIYSMTKPVTATATLLLYEEGRFLLDDPIAGFIPEFGDTKVFVRETTTGPVVAALARPMTIRDLLLHTSGLPYPDPAGSPVHRLHVQEEIGNRKESLGEKVSRMARLPLAHQPGSAWTYGWSTDVLGRLVEVVAGQPFDVFLRERIFEPLAMHETGFHVAAAHRARLATVYTPAEGGGLRVDTRPELAFTEPPAWCSGGGGLVSTAADYARFCQMLLNGGHLEGVRLLSRSTVSHMASDHLGDMKVAGALPRGYTFGLGFAVRKETGLNSVPGSASEFTWPGRPAPGSGSTRRSRWSSS
jgi:CubicO group peptidase (beta-lactamase class C family)